MIHYRKLKMLVAYMEEAFTNKSSGVQIPDKFKRCLEKSEAAPEHKRDMIAHASLCFLQWGGAPTHPMYPHNSDIIRARLILGESPVQILPGLTKAEAHQALLSPGVYTTATEWICRNWSAQAKSVRVARWVEACLNDPYRKEAFMRKRVEVIHGARVECILMDRIDEIAVADLQNGLKSGVVETFERATKREISEWEKLGQDDHRALAPEPTWWKPTHSMFARLLRTRAELIREGRHMNHCVSTYAASVARGQCHIVSMRVQSQTGTHYSTVELSPSGELLQHKGRNNTRPHDLIIQEVNHMLHLIKIQMDYSYELPLVREA